MRSSIMRCCILAVLVGVLSSSPLWGCTSFTLSGEDGSVVVGRSMEFAVELGSRRVYAPCGERYSGTLPDGEPGMSWAAKYASVYIDAFGIDAAVDGMNEAGLSVGCLYLPGYAGYQTADERSAGQRVLSSFELPGWMLQNFASVDEVKKALPGVTVWGGEIAELGGVVPIHYAVYDASGKGLVVEYVGGELHVYDNPLGVLTNAPTFPWHMTNLRNYVTLSQAGATDMSLRGTKIHRFGQGTGLAGLPGDSTPPGRFVRAAVMASWGKGAADADGAVVLALHILNALDIPDGVSGTEKEGKMVYDLTRWSTVRDLTNRRFFYRTYANPSLRMVDLGRLVESKERKAFSLAADGVGLWDDVTDR